MDTYADDLAELVRKLDLCDAIHVGTRPAAARSHGTSGGRERTVSRGPSSSRQFHR